MLRTIQEFYDFADSWKTDFVIMSEEMLVEYRTVCGRSDASAVKGKRILTPTQYAEEFVKEIDNCIGDAVVKCSEGDHVNDDNPGKPMCKTCEEWHVTDINKEGDERTGHDVLKRRMVAVFGMDESGTHSWGYCGHLETSDMAPDLKALLRKVGPESRITIDRRSFAKTLWYYVWDDEVDI